MKKCLSELCEINRMLLNRLDEQKCADAPNKLMDFNNLSKVDKV
jgi:hypothetical protein